MNPERSTAHIFSYFKSPGITRLGDASIICIRLSAKRTAELPVEAIQGLVSEDPRLSSSRSPFSNRPPAHVETVIGTAPTVDDGRHPQPFMRADTAEIRLRRMLSVFAAGRILNPATARSQAIGGMIWGVGAALMEETVMDGRLGAFINHDLAEYHVATNADAPEAVQWMIRLQNVSQPTISCRFTHTHCPRS